MQSTSKRYGVLVGVAVVAGACGGGDTGPTVSPPVIAKTTTKSGDQQSGPVSQALPSALRIVVTRDGQPVSDVAVTWSTSNGSVNPTSAPSNTDGISSTTWTLGDTPGAQSATASVPGATGSPLTFSATGTGGVTPPPPPPPSQIGVSIGNIFFRSARNGTTNPAVDTVAINGTVTWTWVNTGSILHSVQSVGVNTFASSTQQSANGTTYQVTFVEEGTYTYNCSVHGNQMTGQIVVR